METAPFLELLALMMNNWGYPLAIVRKNVKVKIMQPLPVGEVFFYSSAIADLVDWVKERNPTMRNDNLIINLLLSLSISL